MGGFKNIKSHEGVKFSTEYQPRRRRISTKFLSELLTKTLNNKTEIFVDGIDVVTGLPATVKVTMPTKNAIIHALLKQAARGNMVALKEIFDRIEGRAMQPVELAGAGGTDLNPQQIIFIPADSLTDEQLEKYLNENNGHKSLPQ